MSAEMWNMLDFSVVKLAPKMLSGKSISHKSLSLCLSELGHEGNSWNNWKIKPKHRALLSEGCWGQIEQVDAEVPGRLHVISSFFTSSYFVFLTSYSANPHHLQLYPSQDCSPTKQQLPRKRDSQDSGLCGETTFHRDSHFLTDGNFPLGSSFHKGVDSTAFSLQLPFYSSVVESRWPWPLGILPLPDCGRVKNNKPKILGPNP